MAKKKSAAAAPAASHLELLLEAGDYRAARAEAARLEQAGGEEAARAARPRYGPEKGAALAAAVGALVLLAIALLGLRH